MLFSSSLGCLFSLLTPLILAAMRADAPNWLLFGLPCMAGGVGVAWISYKTALSSALRYSEQVKVAFDLYRDRLLKEMRIPLPANLEEEQQLWEHLCSFLFRNFGRPPAEWVYAAPAKDAEEESRVADGSN